MVREKVWKPEELQRSEEFNAIVEELALPRPLLAKVCQTNRSTLHGYLNKEKPVKVLAMAVSVMRLLKFLKSRSQKDFDDYLILSAAELLSEGTDNKDLAQILVKSKQIQAKAGLKEYFDELK